MILQPPPLPFEPGVVSPPMSAETLECHHGKHHKAYVDKTNQRVEGHGLPGRSLIDVIRSAESDPLRNNAGQLWNHNFYWQCLSPGRMKPSETVERLIARDFGSVEALRNVRPKYVEALRAELINREFVARNPDGNGALRVNQG